MAVKSPSKFTTLERLEEIQANNCIGLGGQEYHAGEVEALIWEKQTKKDQENLERMMDIAGGLYEEVA